MKCLTLLTCLIYSISVFAKMGKDQILNKPSTFTVVPINSPVKGSTATFQLTLPAGFEVDKIEAKLKDARDIFDRKKPQFEPVKVTNNVFSINVSKLPPGFYLLYVKVWDKKNKSEHEFKTKFHDYVRFVIDETLQVPMPNEVKNNATVAGIDSDNDGIRDDIQRYINETYADKPKVKLAMKQFATTVQQRLVTAENKQQNIIATHEMLDADFCMSSIMGIDESEKKAKELFVKYFNTIERLRADKKSSMNFSGQIRSMPTYDNAPFCQFPTE